MIFEIGCKDTTCFGLSKHIGNYIEVFILNFEVVQKIHFLVIYYYGKKEVR